MAQSGADGRLVKLNALASNQESIVLGSAGSAPTPPAGAQLALRLEQTALDPGAQGAVGADGVAVEQLGQRPLDALVDVEQARLLGRHLVQRPLVRHRLEPERGSNRRDRAVPELQLLLPLVVARR